MNANENVEKLAPQEVDDDRELNMMRYISKIPTNIISITLGIIALVLGASRLLHLRGTLPFFETLLIVIGIILLVRSAAKRSSAGCCFWV